MASGAFLWTRCLNTMPLLPLRPSFLLWLVSRRGAGCGGCEANPDPVVSSSSSSSRSRSCSSCLIASYGPILATADQERETRKHTRRAKLMTGDSTNSVGCQLPRLWGSPQTLFPPSCEDALLIGPRVEDWLRKQDQSQSQVHRT